MKLHDIYLPVEEHELKRHFVKISDKDRMNLDQHLNYYKRSIDNYRPFENGDYISKEKSKAVRQIEKDEKFWTASTFLTLFYSPTRNDDLIKMLEKAYGQTPPLKNFHNWDDCLEGDLHLFFEPNLPSPKSYLNWLKENIEQQHLIPYIIDNAKNKNGEFRADLEGATNVDALIINSTNGFAVVIEAKVLSDISYQVTYDMTRNQIIRNIDVMLDTNDDLHPPLDKRIPENSLFLLATPETFKINPHTRLYGYKYLDYKNSPETITKELPHRNLDTEKSIELSKRIGWTTWEELQNINEYCCKWLT